MSSCIICFSTFDSHRCIPKMLYCGHTLCLECIITLRRNNDQRCPECKSQFPYNMDPHQLPCNIQVLRMIEENGSSRPAAEKCETHGDDLSLICDTCHKPICPFCVQEHNGHELIGFQSKTTRIRDDQEKVTSALLDKINVVKDKQKAA
mmetsp:Transcript_39569/g.60469  ORF Transcript_39569/g.60469 Transcript_39569/m.60469 type:complete len:149 (+) Transcript_39569:3-449(+)